MSEVLDASYEAVNSLPQLPKYGHYLSNTIYNRGLVQRHLLNPAVKKRLGDDMELIKHMMDHLMTLYGEFNLAPTIGKDGQFSVKYALLVSTYDATKELSTNVVAASVIQEPTGTVAEDAAKLLSTRGDLLFTTLSAALNAIANPIAAIAGKRTDKSETGPAAKKAKRVGPVKPSRPMAIADRADID